MLSSSNSSSIYHKRVVFCTSSAHIRKKTHNNTNIGKRAEDLSGQYMQNKIGNHVRIIKANPTHCWVHITQCYGQHLVREWDQNFHQWKLTWIEILDILGKNHLKNFTPEKTKFFFCYPCQKLNHILNANKRHGVDCYPKFIKSLRPLE